MADKLRASAGLILLLSLIWAPWALGCMKPWAVRGLTTLLGFSGGLFVLGCIAGRRRPMIPRWCAVCAMLLLLQGTWMIYNAHGTYESDGTIWPRDSAWPSFPGAADSAVCGEMLRQISGVLIALLIACDLAAQRVWRWRIIGVIALTCLSICIYGLAQKAGFVPALAHREYGESVFAAYDYHGTAGAYLNLGLPALFALAIRLKGVGGWIGVLVCLAAAFANVSKAAMVIALLVVIALILWGRQWYSPTARRRLAGGLALAVLIATLAGGGAAWRRWQQLRSLETRDNPRLLMLQTAAPMALEAGWFGDGPGSFKLLYPTSPHVPKALYSRWKVAPYVAGEEPSIYSYAHNDYVQFIIEWGWIGGILWAALIAGAIWTAMKAYRQGGPASDRLVIAIALAAIASVLLHSLVDWPLQVASIQLEFVIYLALLYSSERCASF